MVKSIVIMCDAPPIGTNSTEEAIRFAAGLSAIEEKVKRSLVLQGDSVRFFTVEFSPELLGMNSAGTASKWQIILTYLSIWLKNLSKRRAYLRKI